MSIHPERRAPEWRRYLYWAFGALVISCVLHVEVSISPPLSCLKELDAGKVAIIKELM